MPPRLSPTDTKALGRIKAMEARVLYSEQLTEAMTWLGEKPDTIFLGQQVCYSGNALFNTFSGVPMDKRRELPIMEDTQLGMSIGLSLAGKIPVCIFPRMNFLILAMNQLVNHLDKIVVYSHGQFEPKVIIRVAVGSEKPLYPGAQHCGDYPLYLERTRIVRLRDSKDILPAYQEAYVRKGGTVLVEYADLYHLH